MALYQGGISQKLQLFHSPSQKGFLKKKYYIPPWPQVNLIPRDVVRSETFKNIFFFTDMKNQFS